MLQIIREPDDIIIRTDSGEYSSDCPDIRLRFENENGRLKLYLSADRECPQFIVLRWNQKTEEPCRVLGDRWERSYGDLMWTGIDPERFMPWYFLVTDGKITTGCGVTVRPNSFVCFEYDSNGVTAWIDVRNGGKGVHLNGRELLAATFVCKTYNGISSFKAAESFCGVMSPDPILPQSPVYGGNNWYYSYGNFTKEGLIKDVSLISELASGIKNRPFMVIDDGWSVERCSGPWIPKTEFGDMGRLADDFRAHGVRPGIWVRLLHDKRSEKEYPERRIKREDGLGALDPTVSEVKEEIVSSLRRIKSWGFELLKHDFTTYDLFGSLGCYLNGSITNNSDWCFHDRTKTNAEIVLELYRLIRKETEGMILIGCNTVSHLCAGLVEINRIGDDTSGKSWNRNRAVGVNTLAFRLPQNRKFYMVDADCVGILGKNIPWALNREWLDLVARSGSPLFVSCDPDSVDDVIKTDLKKAFKHSSIQTEVIEPLDWEFNKNPIMWLINGEKTEYDWIMCSYPPLLKATVPNTDNIV